MSDPTKQQLSVGCHENKRVDPKAKFRGAVCAAMFETVSSCDVPCQVFGGPTGGEKPESRRKSSFRKKKSTCGLSNHRLLLVGLFLLVSLWLVAVFRFTAVVPHENTHVSTDSGGNGRRPPLRQGAAGEVSLEEHMKNGGGRVVPSVIDDRVLSRIHGVGSGDVRVDSGDRDRDNPILKVSERRKEEKPKESKVALLETVLPGVDFKGGDLKGVGPLDAANDKECLLLCAKDGRCLKWTIEVDTHFCWLKGEGGERKKAGPRIISGIVRTEPDKSIQDPKYDEKPPPPPMECCPASAAKAPPGVHELDLWDDQPGSDWSTSYPLGNGRLGAMLGMGASKDTIYLSDGSLWAGKGKTGKGSRFPPSPERFKEFSTAREALLEGDIFTAQEAAGRMPTKPEGFVSSFEYAGELRLEFDAEGGELASGDKASTGGYIRHLHLNNATAEASFWTSGTPGRGFFGGAGARGLRVHHREAFASNLDGVLAMRFSCREENSGRGCLSLGVMLNRGGNSHVTEAWELPSLASQRLEGRAGSGPGAYLGLFRSPSDPKAEMGFHMCLAILPSGDGEAQQIKVEELVQEPAKPKKPSVSSLESQHADSAVLIVPGRHSEVLAKEGKQKTGPQRVPEPPGPPAKRHRLTLPADGAHTEALVLVSIVTEGEWEDSVGIRKWRTGESIPQDAEAIMGQWARRTPDGLVENPMAHLDGGMRGRCLGRLEAAAELGYEELRRRHVRDVGTLFDRVGFSLGPSPTGSAGTGEQSRQWGESEAFAGGGGSSCVAGLPIRSRVSRSGAVCVEQGEEGARGEELREVEEKPRRTVVDDGLIELMYHYGRYLLISGSRPGGRPINLQGIWANSLKAKWEGDYHMNINLQMAYWGAHAAGLSECAEPLVPFVEELSDGGRQTAHSYYHAPGWVSHANTDRWGGTAAHGDAVWALCPTCGAWMALHLWEAYEYTRDASLLMSSVVPVLEGAVTFFLSYMTFADDGKGDGACLLTGPSTSPENSLPSVKNRPVPDKDAVTSPEKAQAEDDLSADPPEEAPDKRIGPKKPPTPKKKPPEFLFPFVSMSPAIDVSIVRQLLETFVVASREARSQLLPEVTESGPTFTWKAEDAPRLFDPPDDWREFGSPAAEPAEAQTVAGVSVRLRLLEERCLDALVKLPNGGQPDIGADGMIREYRGVDTSALPDPGHRHWSGLWALYPGFQILPGEDLAQFEAAAAAVKFKVDNGGGHTAWSRAWLVNLRARLFKGTEALQSLRGIVNEQSVGSLYTLHPALTRLHAKDLVDCTSCYASGNQEKASPSRVRKKARRDEDGLVTSDGAVFQIDGNLGFLAGVNEMFLQSRVLRRDEKGLESRRPLLVELRLLPALPSEWPVGRFRGLRARGGYEVDVDWEAGEITAATIRAVPRTASGVTTEENRGGEQCRVLSRTQLVLVKGESAGETELEELDGFYEGGVFWHSLRLGSLMADEVVQLIAV